jgi:hypothetical protein
MKKRTNRVLLAAVGVMAVFGVTVVILVRSVITVIG